MDESAAHGRGLIEHMRSVTYKLYVVFKVMIQWIASGDGIDGEEVLGLSPKHANI